MIPLAFNASLDSNIHDLPAERPTPVDTNLTGAKSVTTQLQPRATCPFIPSQINILTTCKNYKKVVW